jgi:hypothetical protein
VGAEGLEQSPDSPQKTGVRQSGLHFRLHSGQTDPAALAAAIGRLGPEEKAAILAALGITGDVIQ